MAFGEARCSSCCLLLSLATFAALGCLGYRTALDDPSKGEAVLGDASPDLPAPVEDRPPAGARDRAADPVPRTSDAAPDLVEAGSRAHCTPGEDYVLVLGHDDALYRFRPDTLAVDFIADVACGSRSLNSLTVSPRGAAYVSNQVGQLCIVDTLAFTATLTAFDTSQVSRNRYGMALLPDGSAMGQSLYIATNVGKVATALSRVDLSTYALTAIGSIRPADANEPGIDQVELTAGPGGELYGFSIGETSSRLLTLDPTTAVAKDVTPVPAGSTSPGFALVDWQGTFYLFLLDNAGTSTNATVFTYRKGDSTVVQAGTVAPGIIGAGVARCR